MIVIKTRKKIFFHIFNVAVICFGLLTFAKKQLLPVFLKYGEYQNENICNRLINYVIEKDISDKVKNEIITTSKNGNITNLDFNTAILNSIATSSTRKIQNYYFQLSEKRLDEKVKKEIGLTDYYDLYEIPLSRAIPNPFLGEIGPKIPIKYDLIGDVSSEIVSVANNYGINNVLLEIKLNIKVKVSIAIPTLGSESEVVSSVPLAIRLIQGEIPKSFYGSNVIGGSK